MSQQPDVAATHAALTLLEARVKASLPTFLDPELRWATQALRGLVLPEPTWREALGQLQGALEAVAVVIADQNRRALLDTTWNLIQAAFLTAEKVLLDKRDELKDLSWIKLGVMEAFANHGNPMFLPMPDEVVEDRLVTCTNGIAEAAGLLLGFVADQRELLRHQESKAANTSPRRKRGTTAGRAGQVMDIVSQAPVPPTKREVAMKLGIDPTALSREPLKTAYSKAVAMHTEGRIRKGHQTPDGDVEAYQDDD